MADLKPPTALITWAHTDDAWTEQQVQAWRDQVHLFATLLVKNGIDVDLDIWHEHDPSIDWTRWGPQRIRDCTYTMIAFSKAWGERWMGINDPRIGAGAVAEVDALKGRFATNQADFQRHTLIVLLPGVTLDGLPEELHRLLRLQLSTLDDAAIEQALRVLSNQPSTPRPRPGKLPKLGPKSRVRPPDTATAARNMDNVESPRPERADSDPTTKLESAIANLRGLVSSTKDSVLIAECDLLAFQYADAAKRYRLFGGPATHEQRLVALHKLNEFSVAHFNATLSHLASQ